MSDNYICKLNHTTSREPEIQELTWYKSLLKVFKSNKQLANQHDTVSSHLQGLLNEIECFVEEVNNERGEYIEKLRDFQHALKSTMKDFKHASHNYDKSSAENHSLARKSFEPHLQHAVNEQKAYYNQTLPGILHNLQKWDEKRNLGLHSFIRKAALVDNNRIDVIKICLNDMEEATNIINSEKDAMAVIRMYKSGYLPPTDVQLTTFRDNLEILRVDKSGIYHIPIPKAKFICKIPRKIRGSPPYQQWRQCNQIIAGYHYQMSLDNSTLEGIKRMIPLMNSQKSAVEKLEKQRDGIYKVFDVIQKKENKYNHIKLELEQMYGPFSIETKTYVSTSVPDDVKTSAETNKDPPPPNPRPNPPSPSPPLKNDVNGSPGNLPENLPPNNVLFKEWISRREKCQALYPFEITNKGTISLSAEKEFWVMGNEDDTSWNTVQKFTVADRNEEQLISLQCLEKCVFLEHRFLVLN